MAMINIDFVEDGGGRGEPPAHISMYKKPAWHHRRECKLVIVSVLRTVLRKSTNWE